jgi:chromate transporter
MHGMTSTLVKLAWHCVLWSLLSIGGNLVTLSDIHRYTVETEHWITDRQFVAFFALSQIAPGPNGLALVLIGQQAAGLPGALTTLAAKLIPSSLLAYRASAWFDRRADVPWVKIVRAGLAPVTVGLLLASSVVLARAADPTWFKVALTGVSAAVIYHGRMNPLWLIGAGAALGLASGVAGFHVY